MPYQSLTLICLAALLALSLAAPLDLGFGGVYNSPAANEYWTRRFGAGFFSNLASTQRDINNKAKAHRQSLDSLPEPVFGLSFVQGNSLDNDEEEEDKESLDLRMEPAPKVLTVNHEPLYLEDISSS